MKTQYKLLSKLSFGKVMTGTELKNMSCTSGNGNCPAVVDHGDEIVIVGNRLSDQELHSLEVKGQVGVYAAKGEVAVKISRELFLKAVEEMMASAQ